MISIPFGSSSEWLVPESVYFSALFTNKEAKPTLTVGIPATDEVTRAPRRERGRFVRALLI